jgi:hypothetical protein
VNAKPDVTAIDQSVATVDVENLEDSTHACTIARLRAKVSSKHYHMHRR